MASAVAQRQQLVLVDPDDTTQSWWPAMVIHPSDFVKFTKNRKSKKPNRQELLVCYFEDASFSIVKLKDTIPFNPTDAEYQEVQQDKGINLALKYWREGQAPETFEWLGPLSLASPDRSRSSEESDIEQFVPVKSTKRRWIEMYEEDQREKLKILASAS